MGSPWDPDGSQGRGAEPSDGGIPFDSVAPHDAAAPNDVGAPLVGEAAVVDGPGHTGEAFAPAEGFFPAAPPAAIREAVVAREEERFGGIKFGSAFFGWLTATAMTVLLGALAVVAVKAGLLTGTDLLTGAGQSAAWPAGVPGAATLLAIPFLAYFLGGYVAGRMARFNGVGQGLMVWLWGVLVAAMVVLAQIVGGLGGGQFNVLTALKDFLGFPMNGGQLSTTSIIALIAVAALALLGAVLGGIVGVHYHRKVDRVGFAPTEEYYQP